MVIQKINERSVELLLAQLAEAKKDRNWALDDGDRQRADKVLLLEALQELTEDDRYWKEDTETQTMRWRIKNLVNTLKNR